MAYVAHGCGLRRTAQTVGCTDCYWLTGLLLTESLPRARQALDSFGYAIGCALLNQRFDRGKIGDRCVHAREFTLLALAQRSPPEAVAKRLADAELTACWQALWHLAEMDCRISSA